MHLAYLWSPVILPVVAGGGQYCHFTSEETDSAGENRSCAQGLLLLSLEPPRAQTCPHVGLSSSPQEMTVS